MTARADQRAAARAGRRCVTCDVPLTAARSTKRFCSVRCRVAWCRKSPHDAVGNANGIEDARGVAADVEHVIRAWAAEQSITPAEAANDVLTYACESFAARRLTRREEQRYDRLFAHILRHARSPKVKRDVLQRALDWACPRHNQGTENRAHLR
jgi:hypothetical protein